MKKIFTILLLLLLLLAGCGQRKTEKSLGVDLVLQQDIDIKINNIQLLQETDKQLNGKYKERPLKIIDGIKYKVDEYETAKGEIGYFITIKREDDKGIYTKVIATGIDKTNFEHDWIFNKIIKAVPFISSTSTQE